MLLTALALLAAMQDARWADVGSDPLSVTAVDRQSIRRSDDLVTIWTRDTFHVSQGSMLRELEMDCRRRTVAVAVVVMRESTGAITRRTVFRAFERTHEPIDPESAEERVFVAVCG